jgi:hypothetical protein
LDNSELRINWTYLPGKLATQSTDDRYLLNICRRIGCWSDQLLSECYFIEIYSRPSIIINFDQIIMNLHQIMMNFDLFPVSSPKPLHFAIKYFNCEVIFGPIISYFRLHSCF